MRRHTPCSFGRANMRNAHQPTDPSRLPDDTAWPRSLQLFALLTFVVNLGTVVYFVH